MVHYKLYRQGMLGMMLVDSLDELIEAGHISPQLAVQVLEKFDQSIDNAFTNYVKAKATIQKDLLTYRFCDDVWTFILNNPTITSENGPIQVDRLKIIACDAKASKK
ncbi:Transcription initiation factor IIA subunit 2 [Coemansia brasiliensis]|uniref:Transcription initiation factor IIA subunit 2 n=1 Tax=Coemansia brasiliensis TaxID=2650707 RepID=A0A9W8IBK9_9FUNG|nr:Transcription initiation factor IIA subunit 2 [Coemansia brasiliensis]